MEVKSRGRPRIYTSKEEAKEKHKEQKKAWKAKRHDERTQLLSAISPAQARILEYLSTHVVRNEKLLQAFLSRLPLANWIEMQDEDKALD